MTNSKTTKRALFTSVLSMLLCASMLIGSTFAWFTDTASTGVNKIMAGNLDVELHMYDAKDQKYVDISDNTNPIFGSYDSTVAQNNNLDTLWEPGKTQVAYLMIKNAGNLALKYEVALNTINPDDGKDLYEVMQYQIVPDARPKTATWTPGAGKTVTPGPAIVSAEDVQMQPGGEHYFALLIHMDESAGNEYQGGKVEFDISVLAAQLASEEDSFDNTYDKDAIYDPISPIAHTKTLSKTATISNPEGVVVLGEDLEIDTDGTLGWGVKLGKIKLDTAYQFEPSLTEDEAESSEYADWHADFVVSVDKDIPADSIALAGYYDAWCSYNNDKWVAFSNADMPITAGTEIRLVDSMGVTVSYEELSIYGNDGIGFLCGAYELEGDKLPADTTLTVELRLYEATGSSSSTETGKYITVGKYNYTFE